MLVRIKLIYIAKRLHEMVFQQYAYYILTSLGLSRRPPTRALTVYLVSSVAPNATTPGAVVTRGPTWDRSASHVTL